MEELKPCPFCGGKARIGHSPNCNDFWIICRECATYYPKDMSRKYTESEAIEAWNTRHERTCTVTREDVDRDGSRTTDYSCGCFNNEGWNHNYCPNCGARVVDKES